MSEHVHKIARAREIAPQMPRELLGTGEQDFKLSRGSRRPRMPRRSGRRRGPGTDRVAKPLDRAAGEFEIAHPSGRAGDACRQVRDLDLGSTAPFCACKSLIAERKQRIVDLDDELVLGAQGLAAASASVQGRHLFVTSDLDAASTYTRLERVCDCFVHRFNAPNHTRCRLPHPEPHRWPAVS